VAAGLGIERDLPPEADSRQHPTKLGRGRGTRLRKTAGNGVDIRVEDGVVEAGQGDVASETANGRRRRRLCGEQRQTGRDNNDAANHIALVRNRCFSPCRSSAS